MKYFKYCQIGFQNQPLTKYISTTDITEPTDSWCITSILKKTGVLISGYSEFIYYEVNNIRDSQKVNLQVIHFEVIPWILICIRCHSVAGKLFFFFCNLNEDWDLKVRLLSYVHKSQYPVVPTIGSLLFAHCNPFYPSTYCFRFVTNEATCWRPQI